MNFDGFISELEKRMERMTTLDQVIGQVLRDNQYVLLSLNRDQMLLGRDANGDVLKPGYLEDPYFRTKAEAEWYRAMKERLERRHRSFVENPLDYPDKDSNTPNLIVRGDFQNDMYVTSNGDSVTFGSSYVDSPDIEQKYNNAIFGLAPLSKEYFREEYMKPTLLKHLFE